MIDFITICNLLILFLIIYRIFYIEQKLNDLKKAMKIIFTKISQTQENHTELQNMISIVYDDLKLMYKNDKKDNDEIFKIIQEQSKQIKKQTEQINDLKIDKNRLEHILKRKEKQLKELKNEIRF